MSISQGKRKNSGLMRKCTAAARLEEQKVPRLQGQLRVRGNDVPEGSRHDVAHFQIAVDVEGKRDKARVFQDRDHIGRSGDLLRFLRHQIRLRGKVG